MAVDAVMRVVDPKRPALLDLKNVKIVTKVGGTIDDSELVDGMVFDQKAAKGAGGPTRVEKAKIGLIQVRRAAAAGHATAAAARAPRLLCSCECA